MRSAFAIASFSTPVFPSYSSICPASISSQCHTQQVPALVLLKALACLEYQSCERPDWHGSVAEQLIGIIRRRAIAALPGYEDAPWGIPVAA